jgi:cation diffusion facilitator CzcD-associated flavoprotein CzcO
MEISMSDHPTTGLSLLNASVQRDLDYLAYPDKPWVLDLDADRLAAIAPGVAPTDVLHCAIVGGGQFGLTLAHGLQRECVNRVRVFDRNPQGREGPWMTFARMSMLRTPKRHTGHELGNASLTFQAWYEAQHGAEGWDKLFRISRPDWQAYLGWYREVTGVDMVNDCEVTAVEPWPSADDCVLFRLTMRTPQGEQRAWARTVVFSSGAEGSGGHQVPGFIADMLPKHLYAHTSEWPIDFSAF